MHGMDRLALLADDLTGACDASAVYARAGYSVRVFPFQEGPWNAGDAEVISASSNSRNLASHDAASALRRSAEACRELGAKRFYKKIDSTLRGQVRSEVTALLEHLQLHAALICPALPSQGRTVQDAAVLVDGVPAHLGAAGRDPGAPLQSSSILTCVPGALTCSLAELRSGFLPDRVNEALSKRTVMVCDAVTDEDLHIIAETVRNRQDILPVGSSGLARALAGPQGNSVPVTSPVLALIGSLHPASRAQALRCSGVISLADPPEVPETVRQCLEHLKHRRSPVVITSGSSASDPSGFLGRTAAAVLEQVPDLRIAASGGDTALGVLRELGASHLDVTGELCSGVPVSVIIGGRFDGVSVITKGGGFGGPETLRELIGE